MRVRVKKTFIDKYTDLPYKTDEVIEISEERAKELEGFIEDPNKLSPRKILYIIIGCINVGLGALGWALPFLPAFPFLLVCAICFGKSSDKLDTWFKGTKLYKANLETYVRGQGMTWPAKIRVMIMVSILMAFGFGIMFYQNSKGSHIPLPAFITLAVVWVFHIIYFCFGVKKYDPNRKPREKKVNRAKAPVI